jgi:hypothetical protein
MVSDFLGEHGPTDKTKAVARSDVEPERASAVAVGMVVWIDAGAIEPIAVEFVALRVEVGGQPVDEGGQPPVG